MVIATRLRPKLLERCLAALARLESAPSEIIVVDNSHGDAETEDAARAHGARYVVEPVQGLSRARNAGARTAHGDVLAFLDDDTIPEPGWLDAMVAAFTADRAVVAAAGRIVSIGVDTPAQRLYAETLDLGPGSWAIDRSTNHWFEICNFGGVGAGGNMAVRRSAAETWPGFRESLGLGAPIPGGEEHYAFFELVRSGGRIAYVGAAAVGHPCPRHPSALEDMVYRNIFVGCAYGAMLLREDPQHRRSVLHFLVGAIRGKERAWRPSASRIGDVGVSRLRIVRSSFAGLLTFFRIRGEQPREPLASVVGEPRDPLRT